MVKTHVRINTPPRVFSTKETTHPVARKSTDLESHASSTLSSPTAPDMRSPRSPMLSPFLGSSSVDHLRQKPPQTSLAQLLELSRDASTGCISDKKRLLVLKVGTSTIMETATANFCLSNLGKFVDCVCDIKQQGYQVVLVSSGAVGAGVIHMKLKERPTTLQGKQAASAVGQCRMMRLYEDLFSIREQKVGQLILTRTDLMDRTRFINFKQTLKELLRLDVVPIINENDSIATAQLRFGDNDTLAAYVAVSLGAEWLFLLTDVDCLYTANPRLHPDAKPIPYVGHLDDVYRLLDERENTGTSWGSGGMRTKIVAAKIATATGIHTALCHGKHPERVLDVIRFAEAHGRTFAEWEAVLAGWRHKNEPNTNAKLHSSQSDGSLGRRPMSCPGSTFSSCADFKGLQHHHYHHQPSMKIIGGTLLKVNNFESSDSEPRPSMSECGESNVSNFTISTTAPSDNEQASPSYCGLVTVPSFDDMPYLATIFGAQESTQSIRDQRRWILSLPVSTLIGQRRCATIEIRGRIYIDVGAAHAIIEGKKSLFAAGIAKVEGMFYENEAIALVLDKPTLKQDFPSTLSEVSDPPVPGISTKGSLQLTHVGASIPHVTQNSATTPHSHHLGHGHAHGHTHHGGQKHHSPHFAHGRNVQPPLLLLTPAIDAPTDEGELARCLVNFSSVELEKIKGLRSSEFSKVLGYECEPEVAHRQNIIFVNPCAVYGCGTHSSCTHLSQQTQSSPPSTHESPQMH